MIRTRPVLKTCEVILNYDCNARCLFCYHDSSLRGRDLPLREAAKALRAGRKEGCWIAYLIGERSRCGRTFPPSCPWPGALDTPASR